MALKTSIPSLFPPVWHITIYTAKPIQYSAATERIRLAAERNGTMTKRVRTKRMRCNQTHTAQQPNRIRLGKSVMSLSFPTLLDSLDLPIWYFIFLYIFGCGYGGPRLGP